MPGSNFTKIILGPGGLKLDLNNNYAGWLQGISGNLVNVVNASFENNLTNGTNNVTPTNYTVTNRLQTGTAATFSTQAYIPSGVNRNDIGDGKQGVLITGVGSDLYQSVGSLASGTTYTLTVSMASRGANNAYGAATGFMSVVDGGSDLGNILGQSGAIALNANSLTDYSITFTTGTASIANATVVLSQLTPNDANRVQLIADNVRLANTSTVDGGLKLLGTGTLSLQSASLDPNGATFGTSGPSTYSGVTDLGVSTIMLDGNDATSANSVFRVGAGASLIVNFGSNGDPGNVIGGLDGNGATTGLVRGNESNSSILGLNVASGTALNYGGTLGMGDPLNLIKSGGGTQTLSGVINYGGRTTLKGGVLEFASTSAVAQAGEVVIGTADSVVRSTFTGTSNTVNFTSFNANRGAGGTVVFETVGGVSGTTNKIVFAGASQGALGAGAFFRADGGAADFAYVNSNASQFLRAPNWGVDAGFVSPGTTLSNNNYNRITGAITTTGTSNPGMNFSGGTLTITSGIVTSTSGVILKSSGNSGAIAGPGILTLGNGLSEWVIRTDAATDVLDIGASLTGSGPTTALTKSGLGVLRLSASNTINGVTSILAGGIDVNNANALANSTVNYLSTGGTLGFSALVVNIGALTGDQTLNINSGTSVRVGGNNAMTIFNGGLSGGGEFHKTGSSFAQLASLAATSTFTGGVFLDSGTLSLVNGSALGTAASSLVLNGGALLYGAANLPFNTAANVVVNASNMTMTRLTGGTTDSMSGNWTSPTRQTMTMALPTGEVMLFNGTGGQFSGYSGTLSMGSSLGSLRVGGLNGTTAVDVAMGNTYVDMGSITLASTSGGTQTFGALSGASASTLTGLTGTATASTSTPATVYAIGGLNVNTTFNGNITNGTGTGATTGLIKNGSGSTLTLATTSRSYTGGTTINTGRIVALGSGTNNLTLLGTGPVTMGGAAATLQFSGANSVQTVGNIGGAGGTTNNATLGAVLVDTSVKLTTGSIRAGSLTIGGSLTLANGSPVSKVQILSIAHTGTPGTASSYTGMLQLGNNRLVLQTADSTSKAAAITALNEALFFGKGTGSSWTGTKGITSSAAAANTAQLTVGVFDNAALNRTNFAGGIGNVDPNSLIVSTALQGDANLDGIVNFNDMLAVTSNWNKQALANGISGIDMAHGDLNSDGIVNFNDMLVVTSHWNNSSSVFNLVSAINDGSLVAELDAGQGFSLSPAQVPEPASVALLAMGSAALLMRRRNKK